MPIEFPDFSNGEVSAEALARFNHLLDNAPAEGASKGEYEAYMEKLLEAEGGIEMIRGLAEQITQGGSLDQLLSEENGTTSYTPMQSFRRIVFRIDVVRSSLKNWCCLSLPSDASFFDLRCAIEDIYQINPAQGSRFELREHGKVEVTFSDGSEPIDQHHDYGEVENRIFDVLQQGCDSAHFFTSLGAEYFIRIQEVRSHRVNTGEEVMQPVLIETGEELATEALQFRNATKKVKSIIL